MAYGDFKDLPRRAPSYKVLRDKAFNIAKNGLIQWLIFFRIKSRQEVLLKVILNQQLAEELRKRIIRKYENKKYIHLLKTTFEVVI